MVAASAASRRGTVPQRVLEHRDNPRSARRRLEPERACAPGLAHPLPSGRVVEQAVEDGLDGELMSAAMLDLLLIAAAKLALARDPMASARSDDFADMARQALDWAAARATPNAISPPRAPRRAP